MSRVILIIDMQSCYLEDYNNVEYVKDKIDYINNFLKTKTNQDDCLIYVKHIISNKFIRLILKLFFKSKYLENSAGFEIDPRVLSEKKHDIYLKKELNSLSNPELLEKITNKEIIILGQDGNYCIKSTVEALLSAGFRTRIDLSGTMAKDKNRWGKNIKHLQKLGAIVI